MNRFPFTNECEIINKIINIILRKFLIIIITLFLEVIIIII